MRTVTSEAVESAQAAIVRFNARFGGPHVELARLCALPLLLTPDLVSHLRTRFCPRTPWIAEADLLLSELCEAVGHEQYAMRPAAQDVLLRALRETRTAVLADVGRLVGTYLEELARGDPALEADGLLAQQWAAFAFVPELLPGVARQILGTMARALEALAREGEAAGAGGLARLGRAVQIAMLRQKELEGFSEVVGAAQEISRRLSKGGIPELRSLAVARPRRVFVSGSAEDVRESRAAVLKMLEAIPTVEAFAYESVPSPRSPGWRDEVIRASDELLMLIGDRADYGGARAEYQLSKSLGKPCAVFARMASLDEGANADNTAFRNQLRRTESVCDFRGLDDLQGLILARYAGHGHQVTGYAAILDGTIANRGDEFRDERMLLETELRHWGWQVHSEQGELTTELAYVQMRDALRRSETAPVLFLLRSDAVPASPTERRKLMLGFADGAIPLGSILEGYDPERCPKLLIGLDVLGSEDWSPDAQEPLPPVLLSRRGAAPGPDRSYSLAARLRQVFRSGAGGDGDTLTVGDLLRAFAARPHSDYVRVVANGERREWPPLARYSDSFRPGTLANTTVHWLGGGSPRALLRMLGADLRTYRSIVDVDWQALRQHAASVLVLAQGDSEVDDRDTGVEAWARHASRESVSPIVYTAPSRAFTASHVYTGTDSLEGLVEEVRRRAWRQVRTEVSPSDIEFPATDIGSVAWTPDGSEITEKGGPQGKGPLRVLVVGTGASMVPTRVARVANGIGRRLARQGLHLLSGGWPGVDHLVSRAFVHEAVRLHEWSSDRLTFLMHAGSSPSLWTDDSMAGFGVLRPEGSPGESITRAVTLADAVILIRGEGYTYDIGRLAIKYGKVVVPIAATGGDAARLASEMLHFSQRAGPPDADARAEIRELWNLVLRTRKDGQRLNAIVEAATRLIAVDFAERS